MDISLEDAVAQIMNVNPFIGSLTSLKQPLGDYVKARLVDYNPSNVYLERQKPYLRLIQQKVSQLFDLEDVSINYDEGMVLDTTEHHSLFNFSTTLGAKLISRFDTLLDRKNFGDYYVLNCGNVPFSDALNRRGIQYKGKHVNLYPKSAKNKLVSRYPLYSYDIPKSFRDSGHDFTKEDFEFAENVQSIIDGIDFSSCKKVSDQIVKINFHLWPLLFGKSIRDDVRRCVTLEHDEILINFLKDFLLEHEDNIIWKTLFDENFRNLVLKSFDGIYGAWNYSGEGTGTYFFWGYSQQDGKMHQMDFVDGVLRSKTAKVRDVKLTPFEVVKALEEGILIPSIFTKFSVVAFYLGAKTMGGPGQTEYTGKFHDAWLAILSTEDKNEYELLKEVTVLNCNCGDIAFSRNDDGMIFKQWGFDVLKNSTFTEDYLAKLSKMEFRYFVKSFIPISYFRLTPAGERKKIDYMEEDLYDGFNWI